MKRPFQYFILCNKTNKVVSQQDNAPITTDLEIWEKVTDTISERRQTKTAYIDTRYAAKIRLYKYLRKKNII